MVDMYFCPPVLLSKTMRRKVLCSIHIFPLPYSGKKNAVQQEIFHAEISLPDSNYFLECLVDDLLTVYDIHALGSFLYALAMEVVNRFRSVGGGDC